MMKTYQGSCHCGAVRYQATLDLAEGTGRCNCSWCTKARTWNANVAPANFQLLAGQDDVSDYGKDWPGGHVHHLFCRHCGVYVYGHGHIPEMGGDFVGIHVNTLDDASVDELMSGPLQFSNGRDDDWLNPPADTRHL